jgi:hypothetical protein
MVITKAEAQQLTNLLDVASNFLESAINCATIPGYGSQLTEEDRAQAKHDQRMWRRIEDWKIRLQAAE